MGNGAVLGKHISFFLDTEAEKSVLTEYVGSLKKAAFPIVGINGVPKMPDITPWRGFFGSKSFTYPFLAIPALALFQ
jgi:hypothetical protein